MHTHLSVLLISLCCAYLCTASGPPKCRPPHAPKYGSFHPRRYTYPVGSKLWFTCKNGFLLSGVSYTLCVYDSYRKKAVWKHDTPVCKPIFCPDLDDPAYGNVNDGNNRPGTKAVYTCNKGFRLVGDSTRKCQFNGKWSGKAPVCKRVIFCPRLRDPRNGDVDDGNNLPGAIAVYNCDKGFNLVGNSKRKCLSNGRWTGRPPVCKRDCGTPPKPNYGSVSYKCTYHGCKAYYRCFKGYDLKGYSQRTCRYGYWAGYTPTCIKPHYG